ncbi:hypothetical protein HK102_000151 [Quaeritorhiza haematococci]|nr:hypothetical protein HK102_000151 [Quaeritorhiza haematococci]
MDSDPISIPDPNDTSAVDAWADEHPELIPYYEAAKKWTNHMRRGDPGRRSASNNNAAAAFKDLELDLMKRFFFAATSCLGGISMDLSFGVLGRAQVEDSVDCLMKQIRFVVKIRSWAVESGNEGCVGACDQDEKPQEAQDEVDKAGHRVEGISQQDTPPSTSSTFVASESVTSRSSSQQRLVKRISALAPRVQLSSLPPEIVHNILFQVAADELDPELEKCGLTPTPVTLKACAVVNKTWSDLARRLLWKQVNLSGEESAYAFYFSFMTSRYSNRAYPKPVSPIAGLDVATHLQVLEVCFAGVSETWKLVLKRLYLLPNLRRLILQRPKSFYAGAL